MSLSIARLYKKGRFSSKNNNVKIETLVLAFFLQTLLFQWKSEEEDKYQIRRGLLRDNRPTRDVK